MRRVMATGPPRQTRTGMTTANYAAASEWARKWLELAPTDSDAVVTAMQASVANSDPMRALEHYHAQVGLPEVVGQLQTSRASADDYVVKGLGFFHRVHVGTSFWSLTYV